MMLTHIFHLALYSITVTQTIGLKHKYVHAVRLRKTINHMTNTQMQNEFASDQTLILIIILSQHHLFNQFALNIDMIH